MMDTTKVWYSILERIRIELDIEKKDGNNSKGLDACSNQIDRMFQLYDDCLYLSPVNLDISFVDRIVTQVMNDTSLEEITGHTTYVAGLHKKIALDVLEKTLQMIKAGLSDHLDKSIGKTEDAIYEGDDLLELSNIAMDIERLIIKDKRHPKYKELSQHAIARFECVQRNDKANIIEVEQRYKDAAKELIRLKCVENISPEDLQSIAKDKCKLSTNPVVWLKSANKLCAVVALLWGWDVTDVRSNAKMLNEIFCVKSVKGKLATSRFNGVRNIREMVKDGKVEYYNIKEYKKLYQIIKGK